jgi:hypothetical protein
VQIIGQQVMDFEILREALVSLVPDPEKTKLNDNLYTASWIY